MSGLGYCKACNVEDFGDPTLRQAIAEVYGQDSFFLAQGREDRKAWEVAMAMRSLEAHGALRPDAEVLGVGAGHEATIFALTSRVSRVFATDLYLDPGTWEETASSDVLGDPGRYWDRPWNRRRLVVQHMDALDLAYEDNSFDGIFSSSSLEHFGDLRQIARSVEEMYRVLRPGGVTSISTELKLAGSGPGLEGTRLFSPAELYRWVIDRVAWRLADRLDLHVSPRTQSVIVDSEQAGEDVRRRRPRWSTYPHLVLQSGAYRWMSVHLALIK